MNYTIESVPGALLITSDAENFTPIRVTSLTRITTNSDSHDVVAEVAPHICGRVTAIEHDGQFIHVVTDFVRNAKAGGQVYLVRKA